MEKLKGDPRFKDLPIVAYSSQELSPKDERQLKRFAESVVVRNGTLSPERMLTDTALFLHRVEQRLTGRAREVLNAGHKETVLAGKKVLIVDDDVRNIFALASALESHGMEVVYAEDGQGGIEMLSAHPDVSVVLMDVMMPGMDGYETIRAIRAESKHNRLPIIAVTAKALKEDRDRCLDAGASDYLPKPVDTDKLVELLQLWVPA